MAPSKSIVVLISGSGTNLQAIIDAVCDGEINAAIAAVISNNPDAPGLERARQANINAITIDPNEFADREAFDDALISEIDKYNTDLIVLAGYMLILSKNFIRHFENRIINIHPSLLPDLKGLKTHQRALENANKMHGASVHFVNIELDSGPVVLQAEVPVLPDDSEQTLAARVLEKEHIIYPLAVAWFVDDRLKYDGSKVELDHKTLERPVKWISNKAIL